MGGGHLRTNEEWNPCYRGYLGHREVRFKARMGFFMLFSRLEKSTGAIGGEGNRWVHGKNIYYKNKNVKFTKTLMSLF